MTLKDDLTLFREHALLMRKAGFSTVYVKSGTKEFSAAIEGGESSDAVGQPIGFQSSEDGEDEDD